jgi:hypothetical protein
MVAGVLSALVAVMTVRLSDRSSRRRGRHGESQRAAESLTRVLTAAWYEADANKAKPEIVWQATHRFHLEQLVQRPVLDDEALREQVEDANRALRDWAGLLNAAAARWKDERRTDPDSGEVIGPGFQQSKANAWQAAFVQVQALGLDLTAHRRGAKIDRRGRPAYVPVELVDGRASTSEDAPVPDEQRTDTA